MWRPSDVQRKCSVWGKLQGVAFHGQPIGLQRRCRNKRSYQVVRAFPSLHRQSSPMTGNAPARILMCRRVNLTSRDRSRDVWMTCHPREQPNAHQSRSVFFSDGLYRARVKFQSGYAGAFAERLEVVAREEPGFTFPHLHQILVAVVPYEIYGL